MTSTTTTYADIQRLDALVGLVRNYGQRITRAIADTRSMLDRAEQALASDYVGGITTQLENPGQLLSDVEPLVQLLFKTGVSKELCLQLRRGEFVASSDIWESVYGAGWRAVIEAAMQSDADTPAKRITRKAVKAQVRKMEAEQV